MPIYTFTHINNDFDAHARANLDTYIMHSISGYAVSHKTFGDAIKFCKNTPNTNLVTRTVLFLIYKQHDEEKFESILEEIEARSSSSAEQKPCPQCKCMVKPYEVSLSDNICVYCHNR